MKEQDLGVKWFNTVYYPERKTSRAVRYEDGVLPRLRQKEIFLFTPWGPRYNWDSQGIKIHDEDKEMKVINYFAGILSDWQKNMPDKNFNWIFLGADLYGTNINRLPKMEVGQYFSNLNECLREIIPIAEFKLWSEYNLQAESYRKIIRKDFNLFVDSKLLSRASQTAKTMGKGGDPRDYLTERLAEAMLIEASFKPIKISCVARNKDDVVDYDLPRLYFLPSELNAPWL